jgi:oligopeptide transport system substrate-binding protein
MRGVRRVFVRNPNHNSDLEYGGNIDVINITVYEDIGTGFALYKANDMDTALVPPAELQSLVEDSTFVDQLHQVPAISVFYFGYGYDKPPFDNVHVRRAFSAIVNRDAFVQEMWQGQGLPMIHFTPTGMAHAPPMNEVGVGYDPEFAAAELSEAGFPDCEGFPRITITAFAGSGDWVEFWTAAAEAHLGCSLDTFTIETVDYAVLINMIAANTPTENRPHVWVMGWFADYPDANNWVNDALSCNSFNPFLRECTAVDDLITQAAQELDPQKRDLLYREISELFFGLNGEFPLVPLVLETSLIIVKPWLDAPLTTDIQLHWDACTIDMDAKLAARGT